MADGNGEENLNINGEAGNNNIGFGGENPNPETEGKRKRGRPTKGGEGNGNSSTRTSEGGAETGGETGDTGIIFKSPVEIPILNLPGNSDIIEKKKPRDKKDKTLDKSLESNVRMIIETGFALTATRLGDIWAISDDEAKSISEPATRILQKFGASKALNKYGDYLALIMGAGVVVIPRLIATLPGRKGGIKSERKETEITKPVTTVSQSVNPGHTINVEAANKARLSTD